jgi:NADH-quinone oxidoreductase subunit C
MNINTPVPTIYGDHVERFGEIWNQQIQALRARFADAIEEVQLPREFPTEVPNVFVRRDQIANVLSWMKDEPGFEYGFLADITATDEQESPRFHVVYQLLSRKTMSRIRLKVRVDEDQSVPTVIGVWPAANWAEREVWDMFGVRFEGHPDLRRILMDVRWEGHPLRKDYPLRGYQFFPTPEPIDPSLLEN